MIWAVCWSGENDVILPVSLELVCGRAFSCSGRISETFLWGQLFQKRSSCLKSLNVQIWVNGLTTWHNFDQHHCFCIFCCWPARATRFTELRLTFLGTCNSWRSTTNGAFITSFDTVHISTRLWMCAPDSFAATRNAVVTYHLKRTSPYYAILTTLWACARKRTAPRRCSCKRDIQN